ncbi:MAG: TMEM43 family protein [Synergistaceae bacterium]|nr:TMEM43 family protein [Synergistaceae bacterium]
MAYTEVETKGWLQRMSESFGGIIVGFVLIAAATWLLWWNEEDTFKTAGAIGEAELVTQDVQDISRADPALEGKVIHATGRADTQEVLKDSLFGVEAQAISLRRSAEFYQWQEHAQKETRKKLGGGEETVTTYTYSREWVSSPINSGNFRDPDYKNANTVLANVEDSTLWANTVTFGAYTLPDFLKHSIGGAVPLTVENANVQAAGLLGNSGYNTENMVHKSGSTVYLGMNPNNPEVGDVRVTFEQTPPAEVSLIAQVKGNTFEKFKASNGYTFSRLAMGDVGSSEMFSSARSDNKLFAWIFRIIGIICVIAGLRMIFKPLSVIADVIPILGTIVEGGAGIVAFLLGLAWSLVVIAVAWVRFRPLWAGGLIAAAVLLLGMSYMKGKKASA